MKKEQLERMLEKLACSKFRSSFHLKEKDILYLEKKGYQEIKRHAYQFIKERLAPKNPINDGKQTPMRGHPVFISEHATATCCRSCLYKWHHISKNKELSENEINYIVSIIMLWITKEYQKNKNSK